MGLRSLPSMKFPLPSRRPARGNSRVIGIPVFMDAKNLQAFIDEDLRYGSKKEKPAHGGLMVIFQLQLEEQIGYLEY